MISLFLIQWIAILKIEAAGELDTDVSAQRARGFINEQQGVISELKGRISELVTMGIVSH